MVILVYLWIGNGIPSWHQVSILFVLTQIYDTATLEDNGQVWASLAYLMIVLAGFTSMVTIMFIYEASGGKFFSQVPMRSKVFFIL